MAKQRSTRTVADVKDSLREAGTVTQRDNTPNPKVQEAYAEMGHQEPQEGKEPQDGSVTRTATLEKAKADADAPLTVTEEKKPTKGKKGGSEGEVTTQVNWNS